MTLYEYVCNITAHGTRVILPQVLGCEQRTTVGEPGNNVSKLMWIHEVTRDGIRKQMDPKRDNMNKHEVILEKITWAAFNSGDSSQFRRKCLEYAPADCRGGDFVDKDWTVLQSDLCIEIANEFSKKAFIERNSKGAQTLLSMLQTRIASWSRKITASMEKPAEGEGGDNRWNINISVG